MAEPRIDIPPLRRGVNGSTARAESLRGIRDAMTPLTRLFVVVSKERYELTKDAVYFKSTPDEVRAPNQQAKNLEAAGDFARMLLPHDEGFHRVIKATMQATIEASVAEQLIAFEHTRLI